MKEGIANRMAALEEEMGRALHELGDLMPEFDDLDRRVNAEAVARLLDIQRALTLAKVREAVAGEQLAEGLKNDSDAGYEHGIADALAALDALETP